MITANEARKLTNEILEPVSGSIEFKAIIARIERDIRKAIDNGLDKIEIISYCLPIYNDYNFPKNINRNAIDKDHFWWPYVKEELEKNGFKVLKTISLDHYTIAW